MYCLLLREVGRDEVVVVHGDGDRDGVGVGDRIDITGPVDKPVADICSRHQADHPAGVICINPLAGGGYRATSSARDGEVVLNHWWYHFKVSRNGVVTVHGDVSYGGVDIANGAHIAGPVDKAVAVLSRGNKINHCSFVIGKSLLSRGGDRTTRRAVDNQIILGCRCRGASNDVT